MKTIRQFAVLCLFWMIGIEAYSYATVVAKGSCGANGDNVQWIYYSNYQLEIKGNGAMKDFSNDCPWKDYEDNIATVMISGISHIGKNAFFSCSKLASVTMSETVTNIGESAFSNCENLSSVTLSANLKAIGERAFYRCVKLSSIKIPSSVETISDRAFEQCKSLTSVVLPNSLTTIANYTFMHCSQLESVTIPASVTTIGDGAFYYCYSIFSITIPYKVKSIGNYAFGFCSALTYVTMPNPVQVDPHSFTGATNLKNIYISNSASQFDRMDEDVNHDGAVNSLDVLKVYKYMQTH